MVNHEYYKTPYSFKVDQNNDSILVCDSSEEYDYIYRINSMKYNFDEKKRVNFTRISEKLDDGIYNTFEEYRLKTSEGNFNRQFFKKFSIINLRNLYGTFYSYTIYDAYINNKNLYFLVEVNYDSITDQKRTEYDFSVVLEDKYLENIINIKVLCPYGDIQTVIEY